MTTKISTILVPTDFSAKAKNALTLAAKMALRHNAKLIIMHAVHSQYVIDRGGKQMIGADTVQQNRDSAESHLQRLHESVRNEYAVDIETILSAQNLVESVNEVIVTHGVDLVVVGTAGRQSVKEFILGSNSYSMMLHAAASVLLVPQDFQKSTFKKILFPVRVENELHQKAELSLLLAEKNEGGINLLGVGDSNRVAAVRAAYIEMRKMLMLKSAAYVSEFKLADDNANVIVETAENDDSDIIMLADQDENSWKSFMGENFFKKVINGTKVPLLIVKPKLIKDSDTPLTGYDLSLPVHG